MRFEVASCVPPWHCKGRGGEWEEFIYTGVGSERDLGRNTVIHSPCWDDWEGGAREKEQVIIH